MSLCPISTFADDDGTPVPLIKKPIHTSTNSGPSKSPALESNLPCVEYLSSSNTLLFIQSDSEDNISCYIKDKYDNIVSTAVISYNEYGTFTLSLSGFVTGDYVLGIVVNGVTYEGTFYVN